MYGKFRCVVKSVKPEQQNQIMEILQDKVRLLQNFPQKVVLDTKKTKLSLIQSNNLLRLLNWNRQ